jgi:hypothetical protein
VDKAAAASGKRSAFMDATQSSLGHDRRLASKSGKSVGRIAAEAAEELQKDRRRKRLTQVCLCDGEGLWRKNP